MLLRQFPYKGNKLKVSFRLPIKFPFGIQSRSALYMPAKAGRFYLDRSPTDWTVSPTSDCFVSSFASLVL